jgi:hypothetical protein
MTNWLMLFREIIAVYCANHIKHPHTVRGQKTDINLFKVYWLLYVQPGSTLTTLHFKNGDSVFCEVLTESLGR